MSSCCDRLSSRCIGLSPWSGCSCRSPSLDRLSSGCDCLSPLCGCFCGSPCTDRFSSCSDGLSPLCRCFCVSPSLDRLSRTAAFTPVLTRRGRRAVSGNQSLRTTCLSCFRGTLRVLLSFASGFTATCDVSGTTCSSVTRTASLASFCDKPDCLLGLCTFSGLLLLLADGHVAKHTHAEMTSVNRTAMVTVPIRHHPRGCG
mmetsp:Transcript_1247/g.2292  ORF Transcript_1247/g.2292 Transcript_1247/m.2292 type:complete len:201 (+) Transcript_1247:1438-2040(+)